MRARALFPLLVVVTVVAAACAPEPEAPIQRAAFATSLAAGAHHTCALLDDGTIRCWGSNEFGQLGHATNLATDEPNPTPTEVLGVADAIQVAAGLAHTCALREDTTVVCWGNNGYGQVGSLAMSGFTPTPPTPVAGLSGVTQISAGWQHTCAVVAGGIVRCWGYNRYGQIGDTATTGTFDPGPVPSAVNGLAPVTQVSAGANHTCAVEGDGTVACWGWNLDGQLGRVLNSGTTDPNPIPVSVAGLGNVSHVTTGGFHSCAVLGRTAVVPVGTGMVRCWGDNRLGQLGRSDNLGSLDPNPTAAPAGPLVGVDSIGAGFEFTCVNLEDGTVSCFGDNEWGQLGIGVGFGIPDHPNPSPVVHPNVDDVREVAVGDFHACALRGLGTVSCWGSNGSGRSGHGSSGGPVPKKVAGIP